MLVVRPARALAVALLVALAAAGCSRGGRQASAPTSAPAVDAGEVPPEDQPDRDRFDFGDTVRIEEDRVVPLRLGANLDGQVTFVNSTPSEVSIRFSGPLDGSDRVESGPVAPGASFSVKAHYLGQFTYVVGPEPVRTGAIEVHTVEGVVREPGK